MHYHTFQRFVCFPPCCVFYSGSTVNEVNYWASSALNYDGFARLNHEVEKQASLRLSVIELPLNHLSIFVNKKVQTALPNWNHRRPMESKWGYLGWSGDASKVRGGTLGVSQQASLESGFHSLTLPFEIQEFPCSNLYSVGYRDATDWMFVISQILCWNPKYQGEW